MIHNFIKRVETMIIPQYPTIQTERIKLEVLDLCDAEAIYEHFKDENVTRFMDIEPCKDIAEAEEIIRFHLEDTGCRWGLFDQDHMLLGTCGYHCWYMDDKRAEIGFDLSKAYWGQGYMVEAMEPVIRFGFEQMGLNKIEATVDPQNSRSINLLKKLGFIEDGYVDNLIYFYLNK